MNLPEKYTEKMKMLLNEEYDDYIKSFEYDYYRGIRTNELKTNSENLLSILPFELKGIPWCENGFYYKGSNKMGKNPYYFAGLYYIQEPSAMTPVEVLDVKPGEKVLDLCAAPGGKSTQIGAKLKNDGLLVSNDISVSRTRGLLKNIELFGIKNVAITSESPEKLVKYFPEYFDKILVDAPCSGEGMFRKESSMIKSYIERDDTYYSEIQAEILNQASKMLKPDGVLVYSTCTFSPLENENTIENFINTHEDFEIEEIKKDYGIDNGKPEWVNGSSQLSKCARLWPHKVKGEGHFVARLKRVNGEITTTRKYSESNVSRKQLDSFFEFVDNYLNIKVDGVFELREEKLYLIPQELIDTKGLRLVRKGLYLGEVKKKRFEPSQAFAMTLKKEEFKNVIDFNINDIRVEKYLKGETICVECKDGWNLVCLDGYPLGFGKKQGQNLKNKYNKSWRWV